MAFTPQEAAKEARAADARIRPLARETDLELSPYYRDVGGAEVFFKLENLQHTGSFKARGALNKVLSLAESELKRGVVAASTGNHGAAAVVIASFMKLRAQFTGKNVVIVLCGANISLETIIELLS
jgi:threonine dehydratase